MKPITTSILFLIFSISFITRSTACELDAIQVSCVNQATTITYETDLEYDDIVIDVFTTVGNIQIAGLIQDETSNSAEVIFLEPGNGEIVVRYFKDGVLVDICNSNVFIFDGEPIPSLGILSNFVSDQVECERLDLNFEMFIECPDCPFFWTLNDSTFAPQHQIVKDDIFQYIDVSILIEELGDYELCQTILSPDSLCYVNDCINIEITSLTDLPQFIIADEEELSYCLGSEITFLNQTPDIGNYNYNWRIQFDTLEWNYYQKDLVFPFNLPGTYTVSLDYSINNNPFCRSPEYSQTIIIEGTPALPILCDSNLCTDEVSTYRAPSICAEYNWQIDETYGSIVSQQDSIISIAWNDVNEYTETEVKLEITDCITDICEVITRTIALFPSSIEIEGEVNLCETGEFIYSTYLIPGANYSWELIMTDSISGLAPEIIKITQNTIDIQVSSYVGSFEINVSAEIPERECEVNSQLSTQRYNIIHRDGLCIGDLFTAELFPKIDVEVVWTMTNADSSYIKTDAVSGLSNFVSFDYTHGGKYDISYAIPSLDYYCESYQSFTVLEEPAVILTGPTSICESGTYNYSLAGLADNDQVYWTIFQDNTSFDTVAHNIDVTWIEGAGPYFIKVSRETEVAPGQICHSEDQLIEISILNLDDVTIIGNDKICYDALESYEISPVSNSVTWEINPPEIGTIVEGENTDSITVQWHYSPEIESANLIAQTTSCGEEIINNTLIQFGPFEPLFDLPDSICHYDVLDLAIENLETYRTIEYYINNELKARNSDSYEHLFTETGLVDVRFIVDRPNECPSTVDTTIQVFVLSDSALQFSYSMPFVQCPREDYQDVLVTIDNQNENWFYQWTLDTLVIKSGFGSSEVYDVLLTEEIINSYNQIKQIVTSELGCTREIGFPLNYECEGFEPICECKEEVIADIDYVITHECNLISFAGSLDFSSVLYAEWRIPAEDSIVSIPILSEDDLIQDSIYLTEELNEGQVTLAVMCDGQSFLVDGTVIDSICDFVEVSVKFPLYFPKVSREFICNEDLTYDVILTEDRDFDSAQPGTYNLEWMINGTTYTDGATTLNNIAGDTPIEIFMTMCSLDGTYCCSNIDTVTTPKTFDPKIQLPNGSCENELWLFAIENHTNDIENILWDFGDGSGSTLFETEKGFPDTLSHLVTATISNDMGCIDIDTLTVESHPNNIAGEIEFESNPCASEVTLNYTELSNSELIHYEWSAMSAADSSSIIINESGSYSVVVTDINGCTGKTIVSAVEVSSSFQGDIYVKENNCGSARALINQNDAYNYIWYVNGDSTSTEGAITINTAGSYELKIVSYDITSGMACDSLESAIVIHPRPTAPQLIQSSSFCDPKINKLEVTNYEVVTWQLGQFSHIGQVLHTSQNGLYTATYTDENQCQTSSSIGIYSRDIDFEILESTCIEKVCREDLDSLQIVVEGIDEAFEEWAWVSNDSLGQETVIASSTGTISNVLITDQMYDILILEVKDGDCYLRSPVIILDIINCSDPEVPEEITCDSLNMQSVECGHSVYKCLLSESNGGPKYYFEGALILKEPFALCSEDSLKASLNIGDIEIIDFDTHLEGHDLHIHFSANVFIIDIEEFEANNASIRFEFCDESGDENYCIEYNLPYRTCNTNFNCLIDYKGIQAGDQNQVLVNYCLNLHEVIQGNCELENYYLKCNIIGANGSKTIYEETINGEFNDLHCIQVPIAITDFLSGDYNCVELLINGDCPGITCQDYNCNIFYNQANISNSNSLSSSISQLKTETLTSEVDKKYNRKLNIFPNPSSGEIQIEYPFEDGDVIAIYNTLGQEIMMKKYDSGINSKNYRLNDNGLFIVSIIRNDVVLGIQKVIIVK